jgi:hypothetical protein
VARHARHQVFAKVGGHGGGGAGVGHGVVFGWRKREMGVQVCFFSSTDSFFCFVFLQTPIEPPSKQRKNTLTAP